MTDEELMAMEAQFRRGFVSISCAWKAADAIKALMAERDKAKRAWECAIEDRNEHHAAELNALDRAERLEAALHYVSDRVKRIKYLAGLDEPMQEQASMALDAISNALAERDALRALLREARGWIVGKDYKLIARIDVALAGDGDE